MTRHYTVGPVKRRRFGIPPVIKLAIALILLAVLYAALYAITRPNVPTDPQPLPTSAASTQTQNGGNL